VRGKEGIRLCFMIKKIRVRPLAGSKIALDSVALQDPIDLSPASAGPISVGSCPQQDLIALGPNPLELGLTPNKTQNNYELGCTAGPNSFGSGPIRVEFFPSRTHNSSRLSCTAGSNSFGFGPIRVGFFPQQDSK
jgi:hypothetical protein